MFEWMGDCAFHYKRLAADMEQLAVSQTMTACVCVGVACGSSREKLTRCASVHKQALG